MEPILKKFRPFYDQAHQLGRNLLGILIRAFRRFNQNRGSKAAASISYYTLFSIFPLLILIITATSYFIDPINARQLIANIFNIFKGAQIPLDTVYQQVEKLKHASGIFGVVGLAGFLWASSGVFETLTLNLDLAWGEAEQRSFIVRRLIAFGIVISLVGIVFVSVIFITRFALVSSEGLAILEKWIGVKASLPGFARLTISFILRLALVWCIFRLVPAAHVKGWPAFWGALVVCITWGIATTGFSVYLKSGFSKYDVIYGSLGVVIIFLIWIYIDAWIFLIGAYLAESIQNHKAEGQS